MLLKAKFGVSFTADKSGFRNEFFKVSYRTEAFPRLRCFPRMQIWGLVERVHQVMVGRLF
jgi:hypothetical protein